MQSKKRYLYIFVVNDEEQVILIHSKHHFFKYKFNLIKTYTCNKQDIVAFEQMKSVLELFYACQLLAVEQLIGNVAAIAAKVEDANGENAFHSFQTTKRLCFNPLQKTEIAKEILFYFNLPLQHLLAVCRTFDMLIMIVCTCSLQMLAAFPGFSTWWAFSTNNPALLTIYYFLQPWTVNGLFDTLVQVSECLKMNSDIDKISLHFYNCCFGSNQGIGCLMLKRTMMAFYPLIQ
ncbi:hypothetical protein T09_8841 [Trichinella sp. T9]|nr:hypothetical protein T09_8841 [Trichinella sp. T9]